MAVSPDKCCQCVEPCYCCQAHTTPERLKVEIGGVGGFESECDCEAINGEWWLEQPAYTACEWYYSFGCAYLVVTLRTGESIGVGVLWHI